MDVTPNEALAIAESDIRYNLECFVRGDPPEDRTCTMFEGKFGVGKTTVSASSTRSPMIIRRMASSLSRACKRSKLLGAPTSMAFESVRTESPKDAASPCR